MIQAYLLHRHRVPPSVYNVWQHIRQLICWMMATQSLVRPQNNVITAVIQEMVHILVETAL